MARARRTDPPTDEATPEPEADTVEQTSLPAELASRFVTAVTADAPTADQIAIVRQYASAIASAAEEIAVLPEGRYKALALTSLEAVFA